MTVDPGKAAAEIDHAGQRYYFCSKGCAARFQKEPEKFLSPSGAADMPSAPAARSHAESANAALTNGVRYTCPMHPQIVQIGPGSCPICGMALEPMDPLAEVEADPEYDSMRLRFWISAALSLPVLVLSMAGDALGIRIDLSLKNWIELLLA